LALSVQVRVMIPAENEILENNVDALKLCLVNLDGVIEQFAFMDGNYERPFLVGHGSSSTCFLAVNRRSLRVLVSGFSPQVNNSVRHATR